jgi:hypothetical protein
MDKQWFLIGKNNNDIPIFTPFDWIVIGYFT